MCFHHAGRSLAAPLGQEHGANLETKAWPLAALDSAGCTRAPHPEESGHTFGKSLQAVTHPPPTSHTCATGKRLWSQNLQRCMVSTRGRCHNSSGRGCVWWRDCLAVSGGPDLSRNSGPLLPTTGSPARVHPRASTSSQLITSAKSLPTLNQCAASMASLLT